MAGAVLGPRPPGAGRMDRRRPGQHLPPPLPRHRLHRLAAVDDLADALARLSPRRPDRHDAGHPGHRALRIANPGRAHYRAAGCGLTRRTPEAKRYARQRARLTGRPHDAAVASGRGKRWRVAVTPAGAAASEVLLVAPAAYASRSAFPAGVGGRPAREGTEGAESGAGRTRTAPPRRPPSRRNTRPGSTGLPCGRGPGRRIGRRASRRPRGGPTRRRRTGRP